MPGKVTTVSTASELIKIAKLAKGGDTILLAPGNYGDVSLSGLKATGGVVTITSAVPGKDAVIESLKFTSVSNIIVSNIDILHPLKPGEADFVAAATVNKSENITFINIEFAGSLNGNRYDDGNGLRVQNSSGVSVLDSSFRELNVATSVSNTTGFVFAGNTVREVREGVNITAVNNGLFDRNYVNDVRGDASKGDHADAFQVHTGANALASNNLTFSNNVITTGGWSQGIFIRSEAGPSQGVTHKNIEINNNYVEGNYRNAIAADWVDGITISNNTIKDGGLNKIAPGLVAGTLFNAVIENNISPLLLSRTNSTLSSNVVWDQNIDTWDTKTQKGISLSSVFGSPAGSGELDFGALGSKITSAGFHAVGQIGNLVGSTQEILAFYVPSFAHEPAVVAM